VGSVVRVVEAATGNVVQEREYDAWGAVLADSNPGWQPFGFAGGLLDVGTGLVRFGARDYEPTVGRWISKDPIVFFGGGENFWAYSSNDPVNNTDPGGKYTLYPSCVNSLFAAAASCGSSALAISAAIALRGNSTALKAAVASGVSCVTGVVGFLACQEAEEDKRIDAELLHQCKARGMDDITYDGTGRPVSCKKSSKKSCDD
jgi:RHS repeat-associated protein